MKHVIYSTPRKSTDLADLERLALDPNIAKSESGWWAKSKIDQLQAENAALKEQLSEANKERAWVRRKLEIPEDTGFLSGDVTLAGTMHNVCAHAAGYDKYVNSYKCDDKQGEIARQSVEIVALKDQVAFWKEEQMAQVVRTNEEIAIGRELEQQLTSLQSKSAALVDALTIIMRMRVLTLPPDVCQMANAALTAFKGEER